MSIKTLFTQLENLENMCNSTDKIVVQSMYSSLERYAYPNPNYYPNIEDLKIDKNKIIAKILLDLYHLKLKEENLFFRKNNNKIILLNEMIANAEKIYQMFLRENVTTPKTFIKNTETGGSYTRKGMKKRTKKTIRYKSKKSKKSKKSRSRRDKYKLI